MMFERGTRAAFLLLLAFVALTVSEKGKVKGKDLHSKGFALSDACSLNNKGEFTLYYATCKDLTKDPKKVPKPDPNCLPKDFIVRLVRTRNHLVKYHFKKTASLTEVSFTLYDLDLKKVGDETVTDVCDPASAYLYNDALYFADGKVQLNISSTEAIKKGLSKKDVQCGSNYKKSMLDVNNLMKYSYSNSGMDLVSAFKNHLFYHLDFERERYSVSLNVTDAGRYRSVDPGPAAAAECWTRVKADELLPIGIYRVNDAKYANYDPTFTDPGRYSSTTPKHCGDFFYYNYIWLIVVIAIAVVLTSFVAMFVLYMCVWRIPRIKRSWEAMAGNYDYSEGEGGGRRRRHHHHCNHEENGEPCDCVCNSDCELETASEHSHTDDNSGESRSKDGTEGSSKKGSRSKSKTRAKTRLSTKGGVAGAAAGGFGEGENGAEGGAGNYPNDPNAPPPGFGANPPAYQGGDGKPKPSGFFIGGGKNQSNFMVDKSKMPGDQGGASPGVSPGGNGGEADVQFDGDAGGGEGGGKGGTFANPKKTGTTKKTGAMGKTSNVAESQAIGGGYDPHASNFAYKGQKGGGGGRGQTKAEQKPGAFKRLFGFGGGKNTEAVGGGGGGGGKPSQVTKKYNAGGNGPVKASVAVGGKEHGRSQYV